MSIRKLLLIFLCTGIFACASPPEAQVEMEQNDRVASVIDPLEPVNRVVWDFNYEILDRFILKPVTQGYVAITPQPVRTGLLNFSENLDEPVNLINNMLEGSFEQSAVNFSRFMINSTVGILGIFDVATHMDLIAAEEDFGQVLGVWGIGTGPYLMIPALGPSDVRSMSGRVVDNIVIPSNLYSDPVTITGFVVGLLETRASLLEQEENLNRALDQYLFVRDAYFQNLQFELNDGQIEEKSDEEVEQEQEDFSEFEDLLNEL